MRIVLFAAAAALATSASAVTPAKKPAPAPAAGQTMMCKDGSFSTPRNACRGKGGVFAATASKTVTAPAEGVASTSVATKLPAEPPARSTVVTVNETEKRATTNITQTTTPGAAPVLVSTRGTVTSVVCVDGTAMKVRALGGACRGHGGLYSSQATAAMRVPAGVQKTVAAKSGTGVAVATTANPGETASATRVTQTTIHNDGVASAVCKDGTRSLSKSRQPCNGRGGVRRWL